MKFFEQAFDLLQMLVFVYIFVFVASSAFFAVKLMYHRRLTKIVKGEARHG